MEPYTFAIPESTLRQKFEIISKDRWRVYFSNPDDYGKKDKTGEDIMGEYIEEYNTPSYWVEWNSRLPIPMAFTYNLAIRTYDANIVVMDSTSKFLAIESPSDQNASDFIKLIDLYKPKLIVKLNSSHEYPSENYFPYWESKQFSTSDLIKIGSVDLTLISYDWKHRAGAEVSDLLNIIQVTIRLFAKTDLVAVSCRGGAGRTGTFIAGCILIRDIQDQLASGKKISDLDLNIDEVFWKLTVQRPFAITHCYQYMTLYRLVDYYLKTLEKR
jgi:protein tyrosine phosphatase